MNRRKAIAHVGIISLLVFLLGVSAVGIYFGYALSNNHTVTNANTLSLQAFALNPATSSLTGTVKVESNSQLAKMSLYVNGTYMGYFDYSYMRSMMNTMMGGNYPYMYSMMYSASPSSMPVMANYRFMQNRTYMITMMATFDDGSSSSASTIVHT